MFLRKAFDRTGSDALHSARVETKLRTSSALFVPTRDAVVRQKSNQKDRMLLFRWVVVLCCSFWTASGVLGAEVAQNTRAQTVQLQRGWNAVFLEVYPAETKPSVLFDQTPVDIVAGYFAPGSSAQFMTAPGADLFSQAGWGVWYAENRPDAFLKTLHSIYGQQAYLIHAKSDFTWTVSGAVTPAATRWQANSYNFTGFGVHPVAAPTFAQFFSGSAAHRHNKIYRLANGAWRRVSDASAEAMRSGEAFWIYCDGASTYQGPLRAETKTRMGVVLGDGVDTLTLRNDTGNPLTPTVEHVVSGGTPVPLSIVVQAVGDSNAPVKSVSLAQPSGAWTQPLPPLEGGGAWRVPLEARVQELTSAIQGSLLKITTDLGTEQWIPVIGVRKDVEDK